VGSIGDVGGERDPDIIPRRVTSGMVMEGGKTLTHGTTRERKYRDPVTPGGSKNDNHHSDKRNGGREEPTGPTGPASSRGETGRGCLGLTEMDKVSGGEGGGSHKKNQKEIRETKKKMKRKKRGRCWSNPPS